MNGWECSESLSEDQINNLDVDTVFNEQLFDYSNGIDDGGDTCVEVNGLGLGVEVGKSSYVYG